MFYREQLVPYVGVIYSWLFMYTQQHTEVLQRTIGTHVGVIYSWLFMYTQHHTEVLQRTVGSHVGVIYSRLFMYTHHHTPCFTENSWFPCRSYLLLAVQVHTTSHCMFYREQLDPMYC